MSARRPEISNTDRLEYAKASARLDAQVKRITDEVNQVRDNWLNECFMRILPTDLWKKQEEAKLQSTSHERRTAIYEEVQAYLHDKGFVVEFDGKESKYILKQRGKVISEAQARVNLPEVPGIVG